MKNTPSSSKPTFTFQGPDGKTFVAYPMETSTAPVPAPVNTTLSLLATDSLEDFDAIEYNDGFIAFDPDSNIATTSVDWSTVANDSTPAVLNTQGSTTTAPISLTDCPFYLDTGATVHISPDCADFSNFKTIPPRPIRGVGGSSISAIGMGDITLTLGTCTLTLKDALFVPNAFVRLISVGSVARDSNLGFYFDDRQCSLVDPSNSSRTAIGDLLPAKRLYALRLAPGSHDAHALVTQHAPDLLTWHYRLGHPNYGALTDMVRNGLIAGKADEDTCS